MSLKDNLFERFREAKLDKNRSNEDYDYYQNVEDFLIAGYNGDHYLFADAYNKWFRKKYPGSKENE